MRFDELYDQYFRLHRMTDNIFDGLFHSFTGKEIENFVSLAAIRFSNFNYVTGVTKDRIRHFLSLLAPEKQKYVYDYLASQGSKLGSKLSKPNQMVI